MHVTDVAQRVSPSGTSDQSWSMIVSGLASAEAAVNNFCEQTVSAYIHDLCTSHSFKLSTVADMLHISDIALNQQTIY